MKAYLGIDVGSISTNLAVLDESNNLLARCYLPTAGRPIEAVQRGLREIKKEFEIVGVGTTGSGRYLIGELVGADIVKNEIIAQAEGALHFDPTVDTIFEIGGQDSKYISLEQGAIVDFAMNKVCAAGTGSFLEEQAEKLGISIVNDFAKLALAATHPSPLGDRCTVFIESELNHYLQKGASKENLAAGLAVAIVKNYLNKVVENRRIGDNIFFQGGVASNLAVVEAFQKVTGKKNAVPPHHDITGAIGIALIALRERNWEKSKFKGFAMAQNKYKIQSFECRGCPNLCEINKVAPEREEPVFYGGRCEKWEKPKTKDQRLATFPDLFKELDEIIFAQAPVKGGKRIGIPRVLSFFERFPFWNAFFSSLGFEVVLSDPSHPLLAEESLENIAAEACFPITLAHGHVKNLLEKGIDYLFLPSIINAEKTAEKFTENFNCPFVQALPYFIKSSFTFPAKLQVLTPALELRRGRKSLVKQLLKFGKSLGKSKSEIQRAISQAEEAFKKTQDRLKKKGREILRKINEEKIPALAIIGRFYNGSDPILNLNIPKKLSGMGILPIPMDYLPADVMEVAEKHPNMYWDCGQKILAAARFINQHPTLSAVYITNFRCGPDSFISHLVKETITSKPYLQIEVDEHSSDTGVITRLEAFLDSLKNRKTEKPKNLENVKKQNASITRKRTVYLPRMCDHALALAAAMRACGIPAETLPPSDEKTLELGRKYTSGRECHPFIITTGDFLKKIGEAGFNPEKSAFFMPTASGPCRFGQYQVVQKSILKQIGYEEVPLLSPDAKDSYGKSMGLDFNFRRLAWQGIVAADLLNELTAKTRPYEKEKGATDELHDLYLAKISQTLEKKKGEIFRLVKEMKSDFASLPLAGDNHKPLIGIVGEIFLRYNPTCHPQIVRKIEKLGGKTHTAPISEWFYYTNLGYIYESWRQRLPGYLAQAIIADLIQRRDEKKLRHHQPSPLKLIQHAAPYLHYTFKGEAVLTIGKALDLIQEGAAGIVNIMPFTCMPGTVVSAVAKRLKEDYPGIPWLDIAIDGNEGVNLETRLEAFMHQAFSYNKSSPRFQGQK